MRSIPTPISTTRRSLTAAAVLSLLLGGCYLLATPGGLVVGVPTPRMTYIADTGIRVVAGLPGDVFYYDDVYWRWYGGHWWRSPMWDSGWVVVTSVPRVFLSIPRSHYLHRVVRYHPLHAKPVKPRKEAPMLKAIPSEEPAGKGHVKPGVGKRPTKEVRKKTWTKRGKGR
jgi:hypothetical protein